MNIFKSTNFMWWQLGLLKWAVLFIGIAIGAYWPQAFAPHVLPLLLLGIAISACLFWVWVRTE